MKIAYLISILSTTLLSLSILSVGAYASDKESVEMNKYIVEEFFTYFSAGDTEKAFALVSDDASWWVPGDLPFSGTKTKAEYMQVVGAIKQGFPTGLKLTVVSMIAESDTVAAEVVSDGDHYSGKKYSNKYHFLIKIKDKKIVEVKEYMDTLHLYQLIQPAN